ncbi:MAG TPA: tetratricopeptide repeat protein, partial [Burkholderiaceae bacterium]
DVAMIHCKLGNAEQAEKMFTEIEQRFSPPPGVLELIHSQRAIGCSIPLQANWAVAVTRGYDRNVNQGASNPLFTRGEGADQQEYELRAEFLPKSDQYTSIAADFQQDLNQRGSVGFLQFNGRRHDALRQYDTASLFAGVDQPLRFGNWNLRGTTLLGAVTMGGKLFQKHAIVQMRVTPPLPLPPSLQLNLFAGLAHLDYHASPVFDSDTFESRVQMQYRGERLHAQASLGYAWDNALNGRPGGDRNGFVGTVNLRAPLWRTVIGEFSLARQSWRGETSYSLGIIDQRRVQATHMARAALVLPVARYHSLQLEVRAVHNNENISIFQYNNRQVQLSWQWQQ